MSMFEDQCERLHECLSPLPMLSWNQGTKPMIPSDGIYFFYERGESSDHNSNALRIVRVGTHKAQGRLPSRLRTHYQGGASIFRTHVYQAMAARNGRQTALRAKNFPPDVNRQVNQYFFANFTFRVVSEADSRRRLDLEERAIATLARCSICRPSGAWIGNFSQSLDVRHSGLWNVHHTRSNRILEGRDFEQLGSS